MADFIHSSDPRIQSHRIFPVDDVDMCSSFELKDIERNAELIGSLPGAKVGDSFEHHRKLKKRIDRVKFEGRMRVSTCVVANEEDYHVDAKYPDYLLYIGEGRKKIDQAMKGGNLALDNSIRAGNEVRVVRGFKAKNEGRFVYVYDGLYEVFGWRNKKGKQGNRVYKFEMMRKPGQARINWKNYTN